MRPVLRRLMYLVLPALILLLPASASAFPLTNCTLVLTSFDKDEVQLDSATVSATDATQTNPFDVEFDGTVEWVGTMGPLVIKDHHWSVSIFNIPTPLSGGDPNEGGDVDGDGTVQVGENLPIKLVGLFYVSGSIAGTGGECSGSGWAKLAGDPIGSIGFWAFLILLILGLFMMYKGYAGAGAWAVLGGLIFGLGGALGLITFSLMLVGSWTPLAAIGVGLLMGIVIAMVGPKQVAPPSAA